MKISPITSKMTPARVVEKSGIERLRPRSAAIRSEPMTSEPIAIIQRIMSSDKLGIARNTTPRTKKASEIRIDELINVFTFEFDSLFLLMVIIAYWTEWRGKEKS